MIERSMPKGVLLPQNNSQSTINITELPQDVISKIISITSRGNDATVKKKKDGFRVYEMKLVEK